MTSYVSICCCHGNQENNNLIFHINFSNDWNALIRYLWQVCSLKVVLNEGKVIRYILTPKSTKLHVVVENENQKHEKWVCKYVKKSSKWPPFWNFWRPFWNFACILGDFFYLKNVAPSHYFILKCKILINSIKQGNFILPAKFKLYFYTCMYMNRIFPNFAPYITIFD